MNNDKDSDERYHMGENDENIWTDDIEFLELGKLSYQKNIDSIGK